MQRRKFLSATAGVAATCPFSAAAVLPIVLRLCGNGLARAALALKVFGRAKFCALPG